MVKVTFDKENFRRFADHLCADQTVIAPALLPDNSAIYKYVTSADEVTLDAPGVPILSAKEFFFETDEALFTFAKENNSGVVITRPTDPNPRVFLGIRSCDFNGVMFIKQFFAAPFVDETVTKKVDNTVFISLGCSEPAENCFCVCCDGGPFMAAGPDSQLVDLGDRYLCETFTDRGEALLSAYAAYHEPARSEDQRRADEIKSAVDRKFRRRSYMATGVKQMSSNAVPQKIWDRLGNRCISCGSCAFVCPTCTCFNVVDRELGAVGARVRTWDSCSYSGFTREVSGHNPRPAPGDRLKRRFFHKLSYQCLQSNGRIGCVGCGRCVAACPAQVDMSTFVATLRDVTAGERHE